MAPKTTEKRKGLKQEWEMRDAKRQSVLTLAEEYALWTIPSLFPRAGDNSKIEMQNAKDSIGAQGLNHLANRVVDVLYPAPPRCFFRLGMLDKLKDTAQSALEQQAGPEAARGEIAKASAELEIKTAATEKQAMNYLDDRGFRPSAIHVAKLLIATGNALIYHPKGQNVQVYNMRNYIVVRDVLGNVVCLMTRDMKSFETFSPATQEALRSHSPNKAMGYEEHTDVYVYTKIELEEDGKYHVTQDADEVKLDTEGASWPKETLPWIALCWNLMPGEDYGRGLVAEYSGAFHALNVLTGSLQNIAAIMGDIKLLVNPQSTINVTELNNSPPGSYHSGKEGDIIAVTINKLNDAQFISTMIERYEKQIAQAFLLNSQMTRDAERVTAEEIRAQAQELETSHGGIYSRLAQQWQRPTANIILDQIDFQAGAFFIPRVVTGLESLSRLGELDAIRMLLNDLTILNNVPEDVRVEIHMSRFIGLLGTARQVDYLKILKTPDEKAQEQAAIQQQQQQMLQQQEMAKAQGQIATDTAKEPA
jgi:hypothetical protein